MSDANIYLGNKTLCDICNERAQQQQSKKAQKLRNVSEEETESKDNGSSDPVVVEQSSDIRQKTVIQIIRFR